ncbi:hypothetical protein MUK70_11370 [Dyadobacter chenwenxiniae]|uniref:Uncharacterized protein n=1 Tax=Dyadobacter chenwenxiniae TaxID=2906456 RepID=A0A9X1PRN0_9BACT|nr:hypothetical protein [Dyadobacter chenwenxiniae]MCF0065671.1 hypothetical protein [Dyadobacter chenwenxiniae]UON85579.1 hypothetical protein MUK70_11370 [Dyadobacter chenwenxiniae]
MMNAKELSSVYDTIMSIPGMNDQIKIDLKISRKNVLLLTQAISKALSDQVMNDSPDLIDISSKESKEELLALSNDCLQKSGLVELNDRLAKL